MRSSSQRLCTGGSRAPPKAIRWWSMTRPIRVVKWSGLTSRGRSRVGGCRLVISSAQLLQASAMWLVSHASPWVRWQVCAQRHCSIRTLTRSTCTPTDSGWNARRRLPNCGTNGCVPSWGLVMMTVQGFGNSSSRSIEVAATALDIRHARTWLIRRSCGDCFGLSGLGAT